MSEQAVDTFFRYFRYRAEHIEAMGKLGPTDLDDVDRSCCSPEQHIMLAALIESLAGYRDRNAPTSKAVGDLLQDFGGPWFRRCSWPSFREELVRRNIPSPDWAKRFEALFDEKAWSCRDDPIVDLLPVTATPSVDGHRYGALYYWQRNGWLHAAEYADTDEDADEPSYLRWVPALPERPGRSQFRPTFGVKVMLGALRDVLSGFERECRAKSFNPCTGELF